MGYGRLEPRAEAFLGSMGSLTSRCRGHYQVSGPASKPATRICQRCALHPWTWTTIATRKLPSCVTPVTALAYYQLGSCAATTTPEGTVVLGQSASLGSAWAVLRRYGNINPLSIDYACRPRLRSRLTQGGLAWPWNPWSSGGRVSHPSFATHACILTRAASTAGSLRCFTSRTTLPYPPTPLHQHPQGAWHGSTSRRVGATASAVCLSPATLSARNHLTSELLRTLSRVAASKPTSWLSVQLHILSHLAHA